MDSEKDYRRLALFESILNTNDEMSKKEWKQLTKEAIGIHHNYLEINGVNNSIWNIITEYSVQIPVYVTAQSIREFKANVDDCSVCSNKITRGLIFYTKEGFIHYVFICKACIGDSYFDEIDSRKYQRYSMHMLSIEFKKKCLELCISDFDWVKLLIDFE
jgi:hypothetical protein